MKDMDISYKAIFKLFLFLFSIILFLFQSKALSLPSDIDYDFGYMEFISNATELPLEEEYDYIVIGGGTAGCPLAATLSEKHSVLLLERGGNPKEAPEVLIFDGQLAILIEEDTGNNPGQKFTSEDGVVNARGRVLGGTSMINAGLYSRGDPKFYAESGIKLDMDVVNEAYNWVEDTIVASTDIDFWQSAVKEALLEANVGPDNGFTLDHLNGSKFTGSTFDQSGRRHGSVELLNHANPKNLRIGTHATVERILFSSDETGLTANGVVYTDSTGKSHKATIGQKGEVILSAGSIGSPQLLLLSGIGPADYLSSMNITVVHDQPYVGKYMFDIPRNSLFIQLPFPVEASKAQMAGISGYDFYVEATSSPSPFYFPPPYGFFPVVATIAYVNLGIIMEKVPAPISYGRMDIKSSTNVTIPPAVSYNYFSDQNDLDRCVKGVRKIGELLETQSMKRFMYTDLNGERGYTFQGPALPDNYETDDAAVEDFCRTTVTTLWHHHGGCLVGKVVDEELRVSGISGLRIVDGSVFRLSPGTNPQATLMMLGRYFGLQILQERMAAK